MIREKTITNTINSLIEIITEGINISEHPNYQSINRTVRAIKEDCKKYAKRSQVVIDLHDFSKNCKKIRTESRLKTLKDILEKENHAIGFVEVEDCLPVVEATQMELPFTPSTEVNAEESGVNWVRNEENKIEYYTYNLPKQGKPNLRGVITREEMEYICEKYSVYGDNLQQRSVCRSMRTLSPTDFRRILTAFNITKASSTWAPHQIEEKSEQELLDIWTKSKENRMVIRAEEEEIKITKKLLEKVQKENIELKKNQFTVKLPESLKPIKLENLEATGNDLILHFADMHLGARVNSGSMYQENYYYGIKEAEKRLNSILEKVYKLEAFDTIVINLLGDNVDCCGIDGKTARLDHHMPQNMDAKEQCKAYISLITNFIASLIENECCSKIKVYSVPCGNHGGSFEYACNVALLNAINAYFPEVETTMFETFFGSYEFRNHKWIICHGKDDQFMRKGLPLHLDAPTHTRLQEWLDDNKIYNENIHFIKGDLHSEGIDTCRRFDYRNVLSLFGASDYANYNFSRNSYGMSYEMFLGDNLVRGTFENI